MNKNEAVESGDVLPISESFYSIQGEGYHTGGSAFFLRIGGCDISCSWCDTKYSWETNYHKLISIKELAQKVLTYPAKSVVITGGEPTLFNLEKFTLLLKNKGIKTFLETTGSYPIKGNFDWVCLSPKQNKPPLASSYKLANELKIMILNPILNGQKSKKN